MTAALYTPMHMSRPVQQHLLTISHRNETSANNDETVNVAKAKASEATWNHKIS